MYNRYFSLIAGILLFCSSEFLFSQTVNKFPAKTDPLHKKVAMFTELMLGNHWNEWHISSASYFPSRWIDEAVDRLVLRLS